MLIGEQFMTHFNLGSSITDARMAARWYNRIQRLAASTRLGIPITISSDPRHSFTNNAGTGIVASGFSQWPEAIGLAALRDADLVRQFTDIARQEYLAVGLRAALHPQVDIATEPRWARIKGTFGEDAYLTSELLVAYIQGFQGDVFGPDSVSTVTKHFPGGGPQENGEDSHFKYGWNLTYQGGFFQHHLIPFKAAIAAGARQIMPAYARSIGGEFEPVGAAFSKGMMTDLLRGELGYDGVVVTDWAIVTDTVVGTFTSSAHAIGVEHLAGWERVVKIIDAGCDQLGGESRPELLVELVRNGHVSEERINTSVRRILREKFLLGLFDDPYIDEDAAVEIVGRDDFVALGNAVQRRSYTLLTNKNDILPLTIPKGENLAPNFYIEGFNSTFMTARDLTVVEDPADADFAFLRLEAPYSPRFEGLEVSFHAGTLEFNETMRARHSAVFEAVPTIVEVIMDRPAAIPEVFDGAAAVFASYGSSPDAFLDVVFGTAKPEGKLPFDLPRSDAAVEAAMEDVPFDTKEPIFRFGHGLRYA
jgi:beta-glucosidase-like glycosyl hydrolase